jgi:hypothetical protein
MPSLNTDLSIEQGSTFVLEFQVFNDLLEVVNLLDVAINEQGNREYSINEFNARMKIKKSKYRSPELYVCGTTSNFVVQPGSAAGYTQDGIYFVGGQTGFMRVVMTAATTATFKAGRYFYDLELVQNIGNYEVVAKLLDGKMEIDAEATK